MVGSVVLLASLAAVGVAIVSSSATASEKRIHLAEPLVRADGGAAGPRTRSGSAPSGSVRSPATSLPAPMMAIRQAPTGPCQDSAPPGASPATLAYVAASNAVVPQWTAISHAIGTNGGPARRQDFVSEVNADSQMLSRLERIKFSGRTAGLATHFEIYVRGYVLQLQLIIRRGTTPPAIAALDHLYRQRAAASSFLRAALGLSSTYACQWLRPGTGMGTGAPGSGGGGTMSGRAG